MQASDTPLKSPSRALAAPAAVPPLVPAHTAPPARAANRFPHQAATGAPPWLAAGVAATALVWPALAGKRWGPQRFAAGIWYRLLHKPGFQPPDKAIPLAWTAIDAALAVGAYRLLRRPPSTQRTQALSWWALNVGLIGGWSGIFFGRRNLPASTAVAAAMVGTGAAYVAQARRVDGPAAVAGVPFVAWVGFATVLTAAIWQRNRR